MNASKNLKAWVNVAQAKDPIMAREKGAFVSINLMDKSAYPVDVVVQVPTGMEVIAFIADLLGLKYTVTTANKVILVNDAKATKTTWFTFDTEELSQLNVSKIGKRYVVIDVTDEDRFDRFMADITANVRDRGAASTGTLSTLAKYGKVPMPKANQAPAVIADDDDPV
jgi:hypothetical protein